MEKRLEKGREKVKTVGLGGFDQFIKHSTAANQMKALLGNRKREKW